jgi:hypothetical protein
MCRKNIIIILNTIQRPIFLPNTNFQKPNLFPSSGTKMSRHLTLEEYTLVTVPFLSSYRNTSSFKGPKWVGKFPLPAFLYLKTKTDQVFEALCLDKTKTIDIMNNSHVYHFNRSYSMWYIHHRLRIRPCDLFQFTIISETFNQFNIW